MKLSIISLVFMLLACVYCAYGNPTISDDEQSELSKELTIVDVASLTDADG